MSTSPAKSSSSAAPLEVPVIFGSAIEGFYRTYRERLTPSVKAEIAALGIDFDHILPAYDLEVFERAFRRAGERIYPSLPEQERWRRLGREFVDGYVQTPLGKAVMVMSKLLGPRRTLERIARTFRTGSNYVATETTIISDTELELKTWMTQPYLEAWRGRATLHLDYRLGILEAVMAMFVTRESSVKVLEKNLLEQSARYRIRWTV